MKRICLAVALLSVVFAACRNETQANIETTSEDKLTLEVEQMVPAQFAVGATFQFSVSFENSQVDEDRLHVILGAPSLAGAGSVEIVDDSQVAGWTGRRLTGVQTGTGAPGNSIRGAVTARCARTGGGEFGVIISATDEDGVETVLTGKGSVECVEFAGDNLPTPDPTEDNYASTPGFEVIDPTVTPAAAGDPGRVTTGDVVLIDPCEAVNASLAQSILGPEAQPGWIVPQLRSYRSCFYYAEAQPLEALWTAQLTSRAAEIDVNWLNRLFFVDIGYSPPYAEFVVLNDEPGMLSTLLDAGTVYSPDGSPFPITSGGPRPDLGSVVLLNRTGVSGHNARVAAIAKVSGYDLWVEVAVSMTEPYDVSAIPQEQADEIIASLPPVEEHEARVLEMVGLLVRAAELAQLVD